MNLDEEGPRLQRELFDSEGQAPAAADAVHHLESKAKAQVELQQGSYDQLEDYNRRIRELRRAVQDLQLEKTNAEARASKAEELEIELYELREQNEKYEAQIRKLCESPFISAAYEKEQKMHTSSSACTTRRASSSRSSTSRRRRATTTPRSWP